MIQIPPSYDAASSKAQPPRVRPLKNRVLLLPLIAPDKTGGGIVIPEAARDNLQSEFIVKAVGKDAKHVAIGQRVLCNTYAGTEVHVNGIKHRLVEEDPSILAILGAAK